MFITSTRTQGLTITSHLPSIMIRVQQALRGESMSRFERKKRSRRRLIQLRHWHEGYGHRHSYFGTRDPFIILKRR